MTARVWRAIVVLAAALILGSCFFDSNLATAAFAALVGVFPAALMALGAKPRRWTDAWPFLVLGVLLAGGLLGIWRLHLISGISWSWGLWLLFLVLWLAPLVLISWVYAARFPSGTLETGKRFGEE